MLLKNHNFGLININTLLNNYAFNKSKTTDNLLSRFDTTFNFFSLSPYFSTLAPVKLIFKFSKQRFAALSQQNKININSKEVYLILFRVLIMINKKLIKKNLGMFYLELKININIINKILKSIFLHNFLKINNSYINFAFKI